MKKRLIMCFLIFAMLVAVMPVNAAENVATIEVETPVEMPKAGEEFVVTAYLKNNPGFCSIQFALYHEGDIMECVEIEKGELLKGTLSVTNPKAYTGAIVGAAITTPVEGDGVFAVYTFTAQEDIKEFDFKIRDVAFADVNIEDIEYVFVGASKGEDSAPLKGSVNAPKDEKTEEAEKPVTEHLFGDATGHWAERYINEATEKGLFKGNPDGSFNPDANVTRAQFVTVLWRMAGSPVAEAEVPFEDIEDQIEEFNAAIAWGYANGYINGTSDTTFSPKASLTREAAMKILFGYSGGKSGQELMLTPIYNGHFEDSSLISDWAKAPMYWGVYNKLISGTSETVLSPQGTATRAQLAKILVNFINTYTIK